MRSSADSAVAETAEIAIVCGPTAAGKSMIAMWLAGETATTIVSADSRQVYRGFDIGTAKPSAVDQARVPHRGIDVAEPTERYSAAAWASAAEQWFDDARAVGRVPLVVGGTGLYVRALVEPLFDEPAIDAAQRATLERALATIETTELRRWVNAVDPARAHLGRTQLLRTIEVACLTGERMSDLHRARARAPRWRARYLLVDPGPALAVRIAARIDEMLDHGWPEEVRELMETIPQHAPAWNSTGYDAVRRLVRGSSSRADAHEEILIATRQYAKRQRTWFRNQLDPARVTLIDPTAGDWAETAARWLASFGAPVATRA
jgi:tRNA dimethylallyltransferase